MDPDQTLELIRSVTASGSGSTPTSLTRDEIADLIEAVRDLDSWLSRGGFIPQAWQQPAARPEEEWARCNDCGSPVEFQAWVTYDNKFVSDQEGADNWCPGCECHGASFTTLSGRPEQENKK